MPPSRSRKRTSAPPTTTARTRRCRRPAAVPLDDVAGAVAPPFSSPLWASLSEDLVCAIAWRVLSGDILDYVRFRAVCTSWRSGTVCPCGRGAADPRFHPCRWMMLPEGHGLYPGHSRLRGYVRFFNLDTGTFVRVKLPLFNSHCALDSVDDLLLLQRDEDTGIRLVHPFTGDIAELPPLATLLAQLKNDPSVPRGSDPYWWWSLIRYCVCATVSCSAGAITVMLVFHHLRRVAFATSEDRQWAMPSWEIPVNIAPLSLQGKLYLVQFPCANGSLVFQMEVGSPPLPPKMIATCPADKLYGGYHLVECNSQILLAGYTDSSMSHISIYKLEDLILERFVPVTSIGDRALFLEDRSLSFSSKALPTIIAETVVYTCPLNRCFAQYRLTTGAWSQPFDGYSDGFNPGPYSLIQHVISCCIRNVWYVSGPTLCVLAPSPVVRNWSLDHLIYWAILLVILLGTKGWYILKRKPKNPDGFVGR
ncbi:unnamed protein product [Triticum turgidum subsp. durum]|uniref:KIB1-4 beta-propeller domain-containing protein n=2 Tax=Triticum TaxID=4564 RepID=A0A9R1S793_TRITD|nr:unnamed protein product [Triticum aestivum]VAH83074.1 unnamed protein product [Triticum turgidum subsp. durum]